MAEHPHGTRGRYRAGCTCDQCKQAENDYRKELRQKRAESKLRVVSPPASPADPAPPADVEPESGDIPAYESVESAIRREIDGLAGIEDKAGHVAMALNLARTLDRPVAVAQHPSATARLMELMAFLRKGGSKKRGKLAAVKDMTGG